MEQFEDRLEILGIALGAFMILVGLGTIAGQPWIRTTNMLAAVGQILGAVFAIAIGAGLVWLTRTETESPVTTQDADDADAA